MSLLEQRLSRRNLLKYCLLSSGAIAEPFLPSIAFAHDLSFMETLMSDHKKQDYINQKIKGKKPKCVISVDYATQNMLEELKEKHKYEPKEGVTAVTFPVVGELGKGAKSRVYVFEALFDRVYRQISSLHKDIEIMIVNGLVNNQFVHAKYFNQGIPQYPIDLFIDFNGRFNNTLYTSLIDILSLSSEYIGLLENKRTQHSRFLQGRAVDSVKSARGAYSKIFNPDTLHYMNTKLMKRIEIDFNPARLFPQQARNL